MRSILNENFQVLEVENTYFVCGNARNLEFIAIADDPRIQAIPYKTLL